MSKRSWALSSKIKVAENETVSPGNAQASPHRFGSELPLLSRQMPGWALQLVPTLEAPAMLKQTNISAGPQQVNNRLEANASNELSPVERHTPVETVAEIDRAAHSRRQATQQSEQPQTRYARRGSEGGAESDQAAD